MFDPGDATGTGTMTMSILPPPSGLTTVPQATPAVNQNIRAPTRPKPRPS